jgi:hypothetical protein
MMLWRSNTGLLIRMACHNSSGVPQKRSTVAVSLPSGKFKKSSFLWFQKVFSIIFHPGGFALSFVAREDGGCFNLTDVFWFWASRV